MPQTDVGGGLPAIKPGVVLRQVTVVRHAREAELALRRRVAGMQPGQLLAERDRLGYALGEVVEFAHVEMRVRVVLEGGPGDWLGTEVWLDGVDNRCRRELALQSVPPVVANGNLNLVSDSYLGGILYTSQTG